MDKDFRYTMPDGVEVEAFQMTEATRYQEKDWPEWMNSRFLLTYEGGEQRLNINDVETTIPKFGWIVKHLDGSITAVGYEVMEHAEKLVIDVVEVHPEAAVDEEGLLLLASKLSGKSVEDLRAEEEARKANPPQVSLKPDNSNIAEVIDQGIHEELTMTGSTILGDGLLDEVRSAYVLLAQPKVNVDEGIALLKTSISSRTAWCSCAPGMCDGERDRWECRQNSPLVL